MPRIPLLSLCLFVHHITSTASILSAPSQSLSLVVECIEGCDGGTGDEGLWQYMESTESTIDLPFDWPVGLLAVDSDLILAQEVSGLYPAGTPSQQIGLVLDIDAAVPVGSFSSISATQPTPAQASAAVNALRTLLPHWTSPLASHGAGGVRVELGASLDVSRSAAINPAVLDRMGDIGTASWQQSQLWTDSFGVFDSDTTAKSSSGGSTTSSSTVRERYSPVVSVDLSGAIAKMTDGEEMDTILQREVSTPGDSTLTSGAGAAAAPLIECSASSETYSAGFLHWGRGVSNVASSAKLGFGVKSNQQLGVAHVMVSAVSKNVLPANVADLFLRGGGPASNSSLPSLIGWNDEKENALPASSTSSISGEKSAAAKSRQHTTTGLHLTITPRLSQHHRSGEGEGNKNDVVRCSVSTIRTGLVKGEAASELLSLASRCSPPSSPSSATSCGSSAYSAVIVRKSRGVKAAESVAISAQAPRYIRTLLCDSLAVQKRDVDSSSVISSFLFGSFGKQPIIKFEGGLRSFATSTSSPSSSVSMRRFFAGHGAGLHRDATYVVEASLAIPRKEWEKAKNGERLEEGGARSHSISSSYLDSPNPFAIPSTAAASEGHRSLSRCYIALSQTLEATTYLDLDEIRDKERRGGPKMRAFSRYIDVERPASNSTQHRILLAAPLVDVTSGAPPRSSPTSSAEYRALQQPFGGANLTVRMVSSRAIGEDGVEASEAEETAILTIRASFDMLLHLRYQAPGCGGGRATTDSPTGDPQAAILDEDGSMLLQGRGTNQPFDGPISWLAKGQSPLEAIFPSSEKATGKGGESSSPPIEQRSNDGSEAATASLNQLHGPYFSGCYAPVVFPEATFFLGCDDDAAEGENQESEGSQHYVHDTPELRRLQLFLAPEDSYTNSPHPWEPMAVDTVVSRWLRLPITKKTGSMELEPMPIASRSHSFLVSAVTAIVSGTGAIALLLAAFCFRPSASSFPGGRKKTA